MIEKKEINQLHILHHTLSYKETYLLSPASLHESV